MGLFQSLKITVVSERKGYKLFEIGIKISIFLFVSLESKTQREKREPNQNKTNRAHGERKSEKKFEFRKTRGRKRLEIGKNKNDARKKQESTQRTDGLEVKKLLHKQPTPQHPISSFIIIMYVLVILCFWK